VSLEPELHIGGIEPAEALAPLIEDAVRRTLDTGPLEGPPLTEAEIAVTLVSPAEMRELNRRFHGIDAPTDVLAFYLGSVHGRVETSLLGDVYVCPEIAGRAACELGIDAGEEVIRLVIHGVLHLLGHDHPVGEERDESDMFRLQERLLGEG